MLNQLDHFLNKEKAFALTPPPSDIYVIQHDWQQLFIQQLKAEIQTQQNEDDSEQIPGLLAKIDCLETQLKSIDVNAGDNDFLNCMKIVYLRITEQLDEKLKPLTPESKMQFIEILLVNTENFENTEDFLTQLFADKKSLLPAPLLIHQIPEDWHKLLSDICRDNNILDEDIKRHITQEDSVYSQKNQLQALLQIVSLRLSGALDLQLGELNDSNKAVIIKKLLEGIDKCTPGFHDRVQLIKPSFFQPQNIDEILYKVRYDLVDNVARVLLSELRISEAWEPHFVNETFDVAHQARIGVQQLNAKDPNTMASCRETIYNRLKLTFQKKYQAIKLPQLMREHIQSIISDYGYVESNKEYQSDVFANIQEYLAKILNFDEEDEHLGLATLVMMSEDAEGNTTYSLNWFEIEVLLFGALLKEKIITELQFQDLPIAKESLPAFVYFLKQQDEPVEREILRKLFYSTKKNGENILTLAERYQPSAATLLKETFKPFQDCDDLCKALFEAAEIGLKSIFADKLRSLDSHDNEDLYFILRSVNNSHDNLLMLAIQQSWTDAAEQLLSTLMKLSRDGKKQILRQRNKQNKNAIQLAVQTKPALLKPLLNISGQVSLSTTFQEEMIRDASKQFSIDLFEVMSNYQRNEFSKLLKRLQSTKNEKLQGTVLGFFDEDSKTLLMHAIQKGWHAEASQLLSLLMKVSVEKKEEILKIVNSNGENAIRLAVHKQSDLLQPLLNISAQVSKNFRKTMVMDASKQFSKDLFNAVSNSQQNEIFKLLERLKTIDNQGLQGQVLSFVDFQGNTLLMLIIQQGWHSEATQLLGMLGSLSVDDKKRILAINVSGKNAIQLAVQKQPKLLKPLLNISSQISEIFLKTMVSAASEQLNADLFEVMRNWQQNEFSKLLKRLKSIDTHNLQGQVLRYIDAEQNTLLMFAIKQGWHFEAGQLLGMLNNSPADRIKSILRQPDALGQTVIQLAVQKRSPLLKSLLRISTQLGWSFEDEMFKIAGDQFKQSLLVAARNCQQKDFSKFLKSLQSTENKHIQWQVLSFVSKDNKTFLMHAIEHEWCEQVERLLGIQKNLSVNEQKQILNHSTDEGENIFTLKLNVNLSKSVKSIIKQLCAIINEPQPYGKLLIKKNTFVSLCAVLMKIDEKEQEYLLSKHIIIRRLDHILTQKKSHQIDICLKYIGQLPIKRQRDICDFPNSQIIKIVQIIEVLYQEARHCLHDTTSSDLQSGFFANIATYPIPVQERLFFHKELSDSRILEIAIRHQAPCILQLYEMMQHFENHVQFGILKSASIPMGAYASAEVISLFYKMFQKFSPQQRLQLEGKLCDGFIESTQVSPVPYEHFEKLSEKFAQLPQLPKAIQQGILGRITDLVKKNPSKLLLLKAVAPLSRMIDPISQIDQQQLSSAIIYSLKEHIDKGLVNAVLLDCIDQLSDLWQNTLFEACDARVMKLFAKNTSLILSSMQEQEIDISFCEKALALALRLPDKHKLASQILKYGCLAAALEQDDCDAISACFSVYAAHSGFNKALTFEQQKDDLQSKRYGLELTLQKRLNTNSFWFIRTEVDEPVNPPVAEEYQLRNW